MSKQVGRNDPCPCGSGRKYKKCCLAKQREDENRSSAELREQEHRNEVTLHVIKWLARHHREALQEALDEFLSAEPEDTRTLSSADDEYLQVQAADWALAEGTTDVDGRAVRLRDLVLEGGLVVDATQRRWFELSTEEPLGLWRVECADPGVGLELVDMLDEDAEPVFVHERSASRTVRRHAVIGARLVRWRDAWELCNVYQIPSTEVLQLLDLLEREEQLPPTDQETRFRIGRRIRDFWVYLFTRAPVMPTVVSAEGGDRIELTTDHWQIVDAEELASRLATQPDVVGSASDGWTRLQDPDAEMSRSLLALNPGSKPDRLEAFAYTRKRADEGRAWLEGVAGPALRFVAREIVDPTSPKAFERETDASPQDHGDGMSPETKTELIEAMYRRQYANLMDEKIPALGDRSAREALRDPAGRRRVGEWLRGFQVQEDRMAERDEREPVDLGYLWRQLGLEPPD